MRPLSKHAIPPAGDICRLSAIELAGAIRQKKLEQLRTDGIPAKYLAELARVRFMADKLH